MGLDITVYQNVVKAPKGEGIDPEYPDDLETLDGYATFYVNPDFPGRAGKIRDRTVYSVDRVFSFRAGSYTGYNVWRENLAKMVGYTTRDGWEKPEKFKDQPFFELVNFSDCEGVLGSAVCALLAVDFKQYAAAAETFSKSLDYGDHWLSKYKEWQRAFSNAAKNGCVAFH